jgi:hypothetical protein
VPLKLRCYFFGAPDIPVLTGFVAATQNQNNRLTRLLVVNSISRTKGQAHFANAFTNRLDVSRVPEAKSLYSGEDFRDGTLIRESRQPIVELIGLLDLEHMYPIGYILLNVNNAMDDENT